MDYIERRERALIIWEEKIRLIPSDVQIDCALWMCQSEMREIAEEMSEWLRTQRAFPKANKREVFFGEDQ